MNLYCLNFLLTDGEHYMTEIPKKVEEIERSLRLNLFPKKLQS